MVIEEISLYDKCRAVQSLEIKARNFYFNRTKSQEIRHLRDSATRPIILQAYLMMV